MRLAEFFSVLWDGNEGYAEIRAISREGGAKPAYFEWPAQSKELSAHVTDMMPGHHMYFGVGLRSRQGGTANDVKLIACYWADVDFKTTPEAEARKLLAAFPLKPSITLMTGGGMHLYWLLREPVSDLDGVRGMNRRIAAAIGGDPNSCDIARILRVPGTTNWKYPNAPRVTMPDCDPTRRYNESDFDILPDPKPEVPASKSPVTAPEAFAEGARNAGLTSLAGTLRRKGLSVDEIESALIPVNQNRCKPPLEASEVKAIAQSVSRYAPSDPLTPQKQQESADEPVIIPEGIPGPDLLLKEMPPIEYAIEPLFSLGNLCMVQGEPKLGKSAITYYAAILAACGVNIHDRWKIEKPRRVLFLSWEDGTRRLKNRLLEYITGLGLTDCPPNLIVYPHGIAPRIRLDRVKGQEMLEGLVKHHKAELVVLDTLSHLHGGDENAKKDMQPVMDALKNVAKDNNCAIVILHHTGKQPANGPQKSTVYRSRGSGVIAAAADIIIDLGERNENVTPCKLISKDDDGDEFEIHYMADPDKDAHCVKWAIGEVQAVNVNAKDIQKILSAVKEMTITEPRGINRNTISAATGLSYNTVKRKTNDMVKMKMLKETKEGGERLYSIGGDHGGNGTRTVGVEFIGAKRVQDIPQSSGDGES